MKNHFIKTTRALAAALLLHGAAHAQVAVAPVTTNQVLHTSTVAIQGLNTASIDVPIGTPTSFTLGQLVACAYLDANGGGIEVKDMTSNNRVTIPYPNPGATDPIMIGVPDVILGNVPSIAASTGEGQAFTMAVGYVGQVPGGNPTVYVDFYSIEYSAWGGNNTFTVNYVTRIAMHMDYPFFSRLGPFRCYVPPASDFAPLGTVHLDVVADAHYSGSGPSSSPYGTPRCDHFFVTYDAWINGHDCLSPGAPSQYESWIFCAYSGDKNATYEGTYGPTPPGDHGLSTTVFTCYQFINNSDWGYQPDIAGIRYDTLIADGSVLPGGGYGSVAGTADVGILAYTNTVTNPVAPPQNGINVERWHPTQNIPSIYWSNGPGYYSPDNRYEEVPNDYVMHYTHPRIDADDDETTNAGYTNDAWKVVYESDTTNAANQSTVSNGDENFPGIDPIYNSSFINLALPPINASQGLANHYLPAVAYSGNHRTPFAGNQYMMTTVTDIAGWGGQALTMQPIERNIANLIAVAPPPSPQRKYFVINSGYPSNIASCSYANSVSTPCNAIADTSVVAWGAYDPMASNYKIYYKNCQYVPTANGYAYKEGRTTNVTNEHKDADLVKLFPNPANNTLAIMAPASLKADGYTISNMAGQEVANGALAPGRNTLSVSTLSPGSYVVRLMSKQAECGSHIFEKK